MCEFPIVIPNALHDLVQDFVASALCERPDNFVDYAVEYHKNLKEIEQQDATDRKRMGQRKRLRKENGIYQIPNQPLEIYPMKTTISDPASIPPDTLLYRTSDTPLSSPLSKSAVVYLTDCATSSHDVKTLVTSNENLDRIKYPVATSNGDNTPIHRKLSISPSNLPKSSSMQIKEERHEQFRTSDPKNPEEIVCKCCGIIFQDINEHDKHSALHFVRASSFGVTYSSLSPSFNGDPKSDAGGGTPSTLFKCLECDLLFKQMVSLRIHYYSHTSS